MILRQSYATVGLLFCLIFASGVFWIAEPFLTDGLGAGTWFKLAATTVFCGAFVVGSFVYEVAVELIEGGLDALIAFLEEKARN